MTPCSLAVSFPTASFSLPPSRLVSPKARSSLSVLGALPGRLVSARKLRLSNLATKSGISSSAAQALLVPLVLQSLMGRFTLFSPGYSDPDERHRVDLDIEGGSTEFFSDFVTQLRSHMNGASKQSVRSHHVCMDAPNWPGQILYYWCSPMSFP